MKNEKFNRAMRAYESVDTLITPNSYIAVRLDGRNFSKHIADNAYNRPFDVVFKNHMVAATQALTQNGFKVIYAYTQSDEITVLIDCGEDSFNRRSSKILSSFASKCSAVFSMRSGKEGCFDARLAQLPTVDAVCDYLSARQSDCYRNSLNNVAYWTIRNETGVDAATATKKLLNMNKKAVKDMLLQDFHISFDDMPTWCKHGVGVYNMRRSEKTLNPKTNDPVTFFRTSQIVDQQLMIGANYRRFIAEIVCRSGWSDDQVLADESRNSNNKSPSLVKISDGSRLKMVDFVVG